MSDRDSQAYSDTVGAVVGIFYVCSVGEREHHGYMLCQKWGWYCAESRASRPSELYSFYSAHGIIYGMTEHRSMSNSGQPRLA